jgi:hypothetical protein
MPRTTRTVEALLEDGRTIKVSPNVLLDRHVLGVNATDGITSDPDAVAVRFAPLTDAQRHALKQGWNLTDLLGLTVAELRARLAAVTPADVPSVVDLATQAPADLPMDELPSTWAVKEHARLKRNAVTNAWRERMRLQAALDTRGAKYAALRAKRGTKASA